jgi:hypothetical protein
MAAIQELTIDEYIEGRGKSARPVRRTKIKLYDKRAALVEIGRELGLFGKKTEEPMSERIRKMTPEQRREHVDKLMERVHAVLAAAALRKLNPSQPPQFEEGTSEGEFEDIAPEGGQRQEAAE